MITEEHYRIYSAITGMVQRTAATVLNAAAYGVRVMPTSPSRIIPNFGWIQHDTILFRACDSIRIVVYGVAKKPNPSVIGQGNFGIASFTNLFKGKRLLTYAGGTWTGTDAVSAYSREIKSMLNQGWMKNDGLYSIVRSTREKICEEKVYEGIYSVVGRTKNHYQEKYGVFENGDDSEILSIVYAEDQHIVYSLCSNEHFGIDEGISYLFIGPTKLPDGRPAYYIENKYGEKTCVPAWNIQFKPFNFDEFGEK